MTKIITVEYFKKYRQELGFTNQGAAKDFFAAKDITPVVDFNYINFLNKRLFEIVNKLNEIVDQSLKIENVASFCKENIGVVFQKLKNNNIIPRLNNQGRRPEEVYFSWVRGFVISNYFLGALSVIFGVRIEDIYSIGDDDLAKIETFKRTPKADLEISLKNIGKIRLEIQSGFQGINDIKQHKVLEAKRIFAEKGISSIAIHFDLFNGQVAFVKLDGVEDDNTNWITRQQMEGQTVLNIDQNYFVWKLTEKPPKFTDLNFD
ncbi:MAG: restriction endonuclease [Patescibacteria group bacterium]